MPSGPESSHPMWKSERDREFREKQMVLQDTLSSAVYKGDLSAITAAIEDGADVNGKDKVGRIPLNRAVDGDNPAAAKVLLDHGAAVDGENEVVLHRTERTTTVRSVGWRDAPVNDGMTPLHRALWRKDSKIYGRRNTPENVVSEMVTLLLDYKATVNARDELDRTPLHYAIRYAIESNDTTVVELLLDHDPDVNARDYVNDTPLWFAYYGYGYTNHPRHYPSASLLELLLKRGADAGIRNDAGNTVVHSIAFSDPELLRVLVENGVDIDIRDDDGNTPLYSVVNHALDFHDPAQYDPARLAKTLKILLDCGADVTSKNWLGRTPLGYANDRVKEAKKKYKYRILDVYEPVLKVLRRHGSEE